MIHEMEFIHYFNGIGMETLPHLAHLSNCSIQKFEMGGREAISHGSNRFEYTLPHVYIQCDVQENCMIWHNLYLNAHLINFDLIIP